MGRGRGRGRKIGTANGRNHEDNKGRSIGEEVMPAKKRRGRPLKQRVAVAAVNPDLAEANNLAEGVLDHGSAEYRQHQQGEGDDAELWENYPQDDSNGNSKRNHHDLEQNNSSSTRSSTDESTATRSSGGFRLNGSRRKSTPRRAAEAGL